MLGEGGGFLRTGDLCPVGIRIELRFTLETKEIRAVAEVRYAVPPDPKGGGARFSGMGLAFTEIPPEMAAEIREYVARKAVRAEPAGKVSPGESESSR